MRDRSEVLAAIKALRQVHDTAINPANALMSRLLVRALCWAINEPDGFDAEGDFGTALKNIQAEQRAHRQ